MEAAVRVGWSASVAIYVFVLTALGGCSDAGSPPAGAAPDGTRPATRPHEPVKDAAYIGINNNTGFNTQADYVARSAALTRELGLGSARMGIDGVGGGSAETPFDWSARDAAVAQYVAAGVEIRAVCSPRSHVSRGDSYAQWQANWERFIRAVMTRYKGKIRYYIVDNEPELSFGQGTLSPEQAVDFTRIAFFAARAIDPAILVESPPVTSPESDMLGKMLAAGLGRYCDVIGVHIYGAQVDDGRVDKPWREMAAAGVHKPLSASEAGVTPAWAAALFDKAGGFPGGNHAWRQRWLGQYYLAMKSAGYGHSMLFSLTGGEGGWEFYNEKFEPLHGPTVEAIREGFQIVPLDEDGFESAPREHTWMEAISPDARDVSGLVEMSAGVADAHGGSRVLRVRSGGTDGKELRVRRVAGALTPGGACEVSAWVRVKAGAKAALRVRGYDRTAGNRVAEALAGPAEGWRKLTVTFTPSNTWAVVELAGQAASGEVCWDDVRLAQQAPQTPPRVEGLSAIVRPGEITFHWTPSAGATHYTLLRAGAPGEPLTPVARSTGTPFTLAVVDETQRGYAVSGGNAQGDGPPSRAVAAASAQGSIEIRSAAAKGPVKLSAEGPLDWMRWGTGEAPGIVRKARVQSPVLGDYKAIGPAPQVYHDHPFTLGWSDGTPTPSGDCAQGLYSVFEGCGFSLTAQAATTPRRLRLWVGGYASRGRLVATLSDASTRPAVDESHGAPSGEKFAVVYDITYRSPNPGQRLVVTWVMSGNAQSGGMGNVTLQAAAVK